MIKQQCVSGAARTVMAMFAAVVVAVAAFVGAAGARASEGTPRTTLPGHYQDTKTERDTDMIIHGAYYSWLASSECVGTEGHVDNGERCGAAIAAGNLALAPWGLLVMTDGSVGPVG